MAKIIGNTTATPNPRPDWAQTDATKADYIKNKPELGTISAKDEVAKVDLSADVQASLEKADTALQSYTEDDPTVPAWAKNETKPSYSLSELSDDADHRTVTDTEKDAWDAKATTQNVADALAEAKAYTDTEIATFDFIKVEDALPETGLPNKIYLVPKSDTQTQDLFDEYIYVNKGTPEAPEYVWEWVTTKQLEVDLTNYVQKEDGKGLSENDLTHELKKSYNNAVTHATSTHPVSMGGTGKTTHTKNAVLTGNEKNAVNNVATADGAFYATAANGAPMFGTLPIAQGGTGATTINNAIDNMREALIDCIYPIGSIYLSMMNQDPNTLFGFGTWERISEGRYLIGVGANKANTTSKHGYIAPSSLNISASGVMGGEENHKLTVNEMPAHTHGNSGGWGAGENNTGNWRVDENSPATQWGETLSKGGDAAHNNMPPYFSVYMWQRTA